jgi:hypothetical protein
MIGLLLAAALAGAGPTAPPDVPPLHPRPTAPPAVAPATILDRYAAALAANRTPSVVSFEYIVDQTGARSIEETHRVFRSGDSLRDELLRVDGKRVDPPTVRVYLGRTNRYTLEALAPHPGNYAFRYLTSVPDGRHADEVFATTPYVPGSFNVTQVTIDGVTALPVAIRFATAAHDGSGSVTFGRVETHWVPTLATARATYAKVVAEERISFGNYRFPTSLPESTFLTPRPLPSFRPPPF